MTRAFPSFVNGRIAAPGAPAVRADDAGFLLGLSVFDTVLFEDGAFVFLEDHLARLADGAGELGIPWPPPHDPERALAELVRAMGEPGPLALRLVLSRGPEGGPPTFAIAPRAVVRPPDPGVAVILAPELRRAGDPLGRVKSTSRIAYVLAREEAQRRGAWEALFLSDEGDVLEGTISNVFAVVDGALVTPSVERGCLPGTARARILEELAREPLRPDGRALPVREGRLERDELARASEVFLTNTTGGALPVVRVQGVAEELPGAAGPVLRGVRERLRAAVAAYRARAAARGALVSPAPGAAESRVGEKGERGSRR